MRWALPMRSPVILGLRPLWRPRARAAMRPGLGAFFDQRGFDSAIRANMPKTSLSCAVVVSTMPLVSGHRSVNASAALAVCGSGGFAVQEGNEFACFDLDGFSTSAGGANVERGCGPVSRWRVHDGRVHGNVTFDVVGAGRDQGGRIERIVEGQHGLRGMPACLGGVKLVVTT